MSEGAFNWKSMCEQHDLEKTQPLDELLKEARANASTKELPRAMEEVLTSSTCHMCSMRIIRWVGCSKLGKSV